MGRSAAGVKGITLDNDEDRVIGMVCMDPMDESTTIFVISANGYGKRSAFGDYRMTNRGGKGVKTLNVTDKTGALVSLKGITDEDDLMITTKNGIMIRIKAADFRVMGRATQGVKVINVGKGDSISDVAVIRDARGDDQDEEE